MQFEESNSEEKETPKEEVHRYPRRVLEETAFDSNFDDPSVNEILFYRQIDNNLSPFSDVKCPLFS